MSTLREELGDDVTPAAEAVQKAFDESRSYDFMGSRTQPWTIARHSVALQLRSRLVQAMNDENNCLVSYVTTGFYPHVLHDAVVAMYLLQLSPEQVVRLEQADYESAMVRIYAWAETVPIYYGSKGFFEATKILGKILHQIRVSWFQVKREEGTNGQTEKKIPTGPDGKSSLHTEPSEPAVTMPVS